MTPKKAVIIILILFLAITAVFAVLYAKKVSAPSDNGLSAEQSMQGENDPAKPENAVSDKINKIIENAGQNPEISSDEVRQEVIGTINAEIIKQEENKTPEQNAADLKAREERQKIIDQINSQIKR